MVPEVLKKTRDGAASTGQGNACECWHLAPLGTAEEAVTAAPTVGTLPQTEGRENGLSDDQRAFLGAILLWDPSVPIQCHDCLDVRC